jgi:hypothetical protein
MKQKSPSSPQRVVPSIAENASRSTGRQEGSDKLIEARLSRMEFIRQIRRF